MGDANKIPFPIKDGDIFRWRFKDEARHKKWDAYKEKSKIFVCRCGILFDTFHSSGQNAFKVNPTTELESVILEYVNNMHNLDKPVGDRRLYPDGSIVNLSHKNNSNNYFVIKGTKQCPEKIKKEYRRTIRRIRQGIRDSEKSIKSLEDKIEEIDAGVNNAN